MDGKRISDGLRGANPGLSRPQIVDSCDALTIDRSYRQKVTVAKRLMSLLRATGRVEGMESVTVLAGGWLGGSSALWESSRIRLHGTANGREAMRLDG